jgi:hypothetical protein
MIEVGLSENLGDNFIETGAWVMLGDVSSLVKNDIVNYTTMGQTASDPCPNKQYSKHQHSSSGVPCAITIPNSFTIWWNFNFRCGFVNPSDFLSSVATMEQ